MIVRKAIVIEVFQHLPNQVIVTGCYGSEEEFIFLCLPPRPEVNFGDILEVTVGGQEDKIHLYYGNDKLRYRLYPLELPEDIRRQLILDRIE